MKNPLPIRFSGTWSRDCDIVLYLGLPLGQYVHCSTPVGLSVCSTICASHSPQSPGPASLPGGCSPHCIVGPGWAWAGVRRVSVAQVRRKPRAVCHGPELAAFCELPCSLDGPHNRTLGGGLANIPPGTQGWPTEACPPPREGLSTDYFTWKEPPRPNSSGRKGLETHV